MGLSLRVEQTEALEVLPVQWVERQTNKCSDTNDTLDVSPVRTGICLGHLYISVPGMESETELGALEILTNKWVKSGRQEFKP